MMDFTSVMLEIKDANEKHGVNVRGGKKYLEVAKRVEIFRKHYGISCGIETSVIHLGMVKGEPVAVRATITTEDGRLIATGLASEVIGAGNVNSNCALENAETSAVGRALACLGLHGGEYASLNEMAAVDTKPENPTAQGLIDAWEQTILDQLPEDPSSGSLCQAYADRMLAEIAAYKSASGVEGYMRKHADHMVFIENYAPQLHKVVREAAIEQRAKFKKEAA